LDVKRKRGQVLVVEDDAALATMYRSALRFAGLDVHVAANAIAARLVERHVDSAA
jgi:DNA-binding response OmpR family regulator